MNLKTVNIMSCPSKTLASEIAQNKTFKRQNMKNGMRIGCLMSTKSVDFVLMIQKMRFIYKVTKTVHLSNKICHILISMFFNVIPIN